MSTIVIILDIVKLIVGLVLTYFVFYLYRSEFRSGVLEKGFRYIVISFAILDIGRSADLLSAVQSTNGFTPILSTVSGTVFSLVVCYGFFLLYSVWHIKREKPDPKVMMPGIT